MICIRRGGQLRQSGPGCRAGSCQLRTAHLAACDVCRAAATGRWRGLSRPTQPGEIGRATRAAGGRVSPKQSGCARSAPRGRESVVAAIRGAARTARSGPSGGYTLRSGCLSTVAVVSAGRVISGVGRDLRWPILAVSRRDRGGADGGVVVPAFCCCLLSMPPRRRQRRASTGTSRRTIGLRSGSRRAL